MRFHISYEDDNANFELTVEAPQRTPKVVAAIKWAISQVPQEVPPTLRITDPGGQRIQVIKVVRMLLNLGLKEAKDLVESPVPIKLTVSNVEEAAKMLKDAGASIDYV